MKNSKVDLYLKILNNNQKSNNWIFGHISFNRIHTHKNNLVKEILSALKKKNQLEFSVNYFVKQGKAR